MDTAPPPTKRQIKLAPYMDQKVAWPQSGQHILAQSDEDSILVYQAYNKTIGAHASANKKLVGIPEYSPTRMTWIKTNFLWMMYRCGWATKDCNQEVVLAIWLKKSAWHKLLSHAHHSGYKQSIYGCKEGYNKAITQARQNDHGTGYGFVRIQWDPDHSPSGSPHPHRRAIQIGMK